MLSTVHSDVCLNFGVNLRMKRLPKLAINFMQNYGMDKVHTRQNYVVSSNKDKIDERPHIFHN